MFLVTIAIENNKGKVTTEKYDCDDMVDVSRLLITYKPKRNYTFVNAIIDKVEGLVYWK